MLCLMLFSLGASLESEFLLEAWPVAFDSHLFRIEPCDDASAMQVAKPSALLTPSKMMLLMGADQAAQAPGEAMVCLAYCWLVGNMRIVHYWGYVGLYSLFSTSTKTDGELLVLTGKLAV